MEGFGKKLAVIIAVLLIGGYFFLSTVIVVDAGHTGVKKTLGKVDPDAYPPGVYIVVPDPDAHCLHARNEGAVVVDEPHDNPGYPGRGYTALDPEGNVWSFGSYDPWTD